jgi:hypothetical protein
MIKTCHYLLNGISCITKEIGNCFITKSGCSYIIVACFCFILCHYIFSTAVASLGIPLRCKSGGAYYQEKFGIKPNLIQTKGEQKVNKISSLYHHSLIAPSVNPLIICFWNVNIKTKTGIRERVIPALR